MQNRINKNIIVVFGFSILAKLISLLIIGYPAKTLGPENFGIIVTGLSIAAYSSIIIWPGIANWGSMEIARNPERTNEIVSGVIFSRTFLALLAIITVALITNLTSLTSTEKYVIYASLLILIPLALNCDWVYYGKESPKRPAIIAIIIAVLNVILIKYFIKSPSDLIIYAFIPPITSMIFSIGLLASLREIDIKINIPKLETIIILFKQSRYLGFAGAIIIILQYANNLIVRSSLDTQSAGIFGAAFFLFQVTMLVPATLNSVFMGTVARNIVKKEEIINSLICKIFEIYILLGLTLGFLVYIGAPFIIEKLYGHKYLESIWLLKLISFGIVFNFAITAVAGFLAALKKEKSVLLAVIVSLCTSVIGGTLLVSIYGLAGAAFTFILIDATGLVVAYYSLKNRLPKVFAPKIKYIVSNLFFMYATFEVTIRYFPEYIIQIQIVFATIAIINAYYNLLPLISNLSTDKNE